jgi:hypothetical protein
MQSLPVSFTNHFLFLSYIRNKKKEKRTNKTFGRRRRRKKRRHRYKTRKNRQICCWLKNNKEIVRYTKKKTQSTIDEKQMKIFINKSKKTKAAKFLFIIYIHGLKVRARVDVFY